MLGVTRRSPIFCTFHPECPLGSVLPASLYRGSSKPRLTVSTDSRVMSSRNCICVTIPAAFRSRETLRKRFSDGYTQSSQHEGEPSYRQSSAPDVAAVSIRPSGFWQSNQFAFVPGTNPWHRSNSRASGCHVFSPRCARLICSPLAGTAYAPAPRQENPPRRSPCSRSHPHVRPETILFEHCSSYARSERPQPASRSPRALPLA